jgi:hypothetical protein
MFDYTLNRHPLLNIVGFNVRRGPGFPPAEGAQIVAGSGSPGLAILPARLHSNTGALPPCAVGAARCQPQILAESWSGAAIRSWFTRGMTLDIRQHA